jgi:hypothetical protein
VASYQEDDLRISLVYRARCFASAQEAQRYANQPESEKMTLKGILETLYDDLVNNKIVSSREELDAMTIVDRAFLIMNTYVKYPLPPADVALVPVNYCALGKKYPILNPLLKLLSCK